LYPKGYRGFESLSLRQTSLALRASFVWANALRWPRLAAKALLSRPE